MTKVTMLKDHPGEGAKAGDDIVFMDDALAQKLIDEGYAKPHEPKPADA